MSPPRSTTLSEAASKRLLADYGVPVLPDRSVLTTEEAVAAAAALGYPVVVKLGGDAIAHKTERGLVRLNLGDETAVRDAADDLLARGDGGRRRGAPARRADGARGPGAHRRAAHGRASSGAA